jgi:hypothetical protein
MPRLVAVKPSTRIRVALVALLLLVAVAYLLRLA